MAPPIQATRCVASAPERPSVWTSPLSSGRSAAREVAFQDRPSLRRRCALFWCWQEPARGRYCEAHAPLMEGV